MNIAGKRVLLRAVELTDMPMMQQWANDPEIQYSLGGWHFPTNKNDQEKWFHTLSCHSNNQRFMIMNEENLPIGMANLVNINFKDGNADLGLLLDKMFRRKGYGYDIVYALMNYAFNELRLNRLETTIIADNEASLHLFLDKCGWQKEGILRNWYFRKGKFIDKCFLGILKEEFTVQK